MRAGRLRHIVTIQEPVETQDSMGHPAVTWSDVATRRASIEPLSGREFFTAKEFHADVSTRIRLRYLAGVTPKMRVKWGDRYFNIHSAISPDKKNRELVLMVSESV